MYHSWCRSAGPHVEVVPITPPGRLHRIREPPLVDFEAYVESLGNAVRAFADRPFAFFGHSLGGLVALEVARWLSAHSTAMPSHLIVSACAAPSGESAQIARKRNLLSDADLLASIGIGPAPSRMLAVEKELRTLGLSALRDDLALAASYVHRIVPPLPCPIFALVGRDDPLVRTQDVISWEKETCDKFAVIGFPGGHMFLDDSGSEVLRVVWSLIFPSTPARLS